MKNVEKSGKVKHIKISLKQIIHISLRKGNSRTFSYDLLNTMLPGLEGGEETTN